MPTRILRPGSRELLCAGQEFRKGAKGASIGRRVEEIHGLDMGRRIVEIMLLRAARRCGEMSAKSVPIQPIARSSVHDRKPHHPFNGQRPPRAGVEYFRPQEKARSRVETAETNESADRLTFALKFSPRGPKTQVGGRLSPRIEPARQQRQCSTRQPISSFRRNPNVDRYQ
jgi:hypothetical protein